MNALVKRRIIVLLGVLCVLYFGWALVSGYFQARSVLRRYAALELRQAELARQNTELKIRLAETQSAEFIELYARDRLGLVRPGETAYKIVKED